MGKWFRKRTLEFLELPSQIAQVFPQFILSPDLVAKLIKVSIQVSNDFRSPANKNSVSSAYWEILCSTLPIFMPFISVFPNRYC